VNGFGLSAGVGIVGLLYVLILWNWRLGLYGLVAYLPFAGAVATLLYPSKAPLLFKDFLFAVPLYVSFFVRMCLGRRWLKGFPGVPCFLLSALALLVIIQSWNPQVANWEMALIGIKVWLFYVPLIFVGYSYVESQDDLFRLLRLTVALSFVPALFGLLEFVLTQAIGYEPVMAAIYGPAAQSATQGFFHPEIAFGVRFGRIPSTFTFVTQYFCYLLVVIAASFALYEADPSKFWRGAALAPLAVLSLAAFLSGEIAAFVFVPMVLMLAWMLCRGARALLPASAALAAVLGIAVVALGIDPTALAGYVWRLATRYSSEIAYGDLATALSLAPFGAGTGTDTGPARFAVATIMVGVENYYAKTLYELGIGGLLIVWGLVAAFCVSGLRVRRQVKGRALFSVASALTALLVALLVYLFKGPLLDIDPLNVLYWLFAGMLLKLPHLEQSPIPLDSTTDMLTAATGTASRPTL
jgi:hypothetical protein